MVLGDAYLWGWSPHNEIRALMLSSGPSPGALTRFQICWLRDPGFPSLQTEKQMVTVYTAAQWVVFCRDRNRLRHALYPHQPHPSPWQMLSLGSGCSGHFTYRESHSVWCLVTDFPHFARGSQASSTFSTLQYFTPFYGPATFHCVGVQWVPPSPSFSRWESLSKVRGGLRSHLPAGPSFGDLPRGTSLPHMRQPTSYSTSLLHTQLHQPISHDRPTRSHGRNRFLEKNKYDFITYIPFCKVSRDKSQLTKKLNDSSMFSLTFALPTLHPAICYSL